ncbi:hypothetical protein SK128_007771 [Halocaridina rubra]|uniref:Uncharacterized protein n=1 Tax=Halocaridina rubra TaxID=373956 RepID=A0AAN8XSF8_HALRR
MEQSKPVTHMIRPGLKEIQHIYDEAKRKRKLLPITMFLTLKFMIVSLSSTPDNPQLSTYTPADNTSRKSSAISSTSADITPSKHQRSAGEDDVRYGQFYFFTRLGVTLLKKKKISSPTGAANQEKTPRNSEKVAEKEVTVLQSTPAPYWTRKPGRGFGHPGDYLISLQNIIYFILRNDSPGVISRRLLTGDTDSNLRTTTNPYVEHAPQLSLRANRLKIVFCNSCKNWT